MNKCPYHLGTECLTVLSTLTEYTKHKGEYKVEGSNPLNAVICDIANKPVGFYYKKHFITFTEQRKGKKWVDTQIRINEVINDESNSKGKV